MTRRTYLALGAASSVCAAALLLLALTGCKGPTGAAAETGKAASLRVATVSPTRQDLKRVSEAVPAELMPFEKTDLCAKVAGFLKEIRVDYGDRVKKGELLATLWVPELEKEHEQKKALAVRAEADVGLAREAVRDAEAHFKFMKSQYDRLTRVGKSGVIDTQAVEEAQHKFESSKAKWDMAKADVAVKQATVLVAQAERDQLAALLEYTRIVAPYDGVITRRHLHTGAFVNPKSGDLALLTVVRTDLLRVIVDVPEKEIRYLDPASRMVVDLDALPDQKFEWPINRRAPVLGGGKKLRVEADVPNPSGTFYPGMYGHAVVILEEKPGALTIPLSCLTQDGPTFVWLVVDGKATKRRVTVGLRAGDRAEVTSGLEGSEEIVHSPKALSEGQAVQAEKMVAAGK